MDALELIIFGTFVTLLPKEIFFFFFDSPTAKAKRSVDCQQNKNVDQGGSIPKSNA